MGAKMFFEQYITQLPCENHLVKFTFFVNEKPINFDPFCRPSGLDILLRSLYCLGVEMPKYAFPPRASHLGQTRKLQDLGYNL